jgi:hypothetical protein
MPEGQHPLPKPHALAVASKVLQATNQVSENKSSNQFPFSHYRKIPPCFAGFLQDMAKKIAVLKYSNRLKPSILQWGEPTS